MGSRSPRVPGLAPFWLLLVVLSLQVLGAGGRPLPAQGRRSTFHGKRAWTGSCNSDFDLYLVLDISSSMKSNWLDVYTFVEDLVNRFKNPKLRMSFILYSTEGTTLMPLTSDRDKIELSLGDLKNIRPKGATNMQNGLKRANEQIVRASQGGKMVSSMIIAFTDGTLEPKPYEETKYEAQRARLMGAIVYAVGVKDYDQSQLEGFADTKDHVFGVTGGFSALQGITDRLAEKSCVYLASVEPSHACVGGEYTVVVRGSGLQNTRGKKSVICRFTFSDGTSFVTTATSVDEKAIVCSEVKLKEAGEEIFIEISLNEGKTFFSNNLKLTSQQCPDPETTMETTTKTTTTKAPVVTKPKSDAFHLNTVGASCAGVVFLLQLLWWLYYLYKWISALLSCLLNPGASPASPQVVPGAPEGTGSILPPLEPREHLGCSRPPFLAAMGHPEDALPAGPGLSWCPQSGVGTVDDGDTHPSWGVATGQHGAEQVHRDRGPKEATTTTTTTM